MCKNRELCIDELCRTRYKYQHWMHANRVRYIALCNPVAQYLDKDVLSIITIGHDLFEKTDVTAEELRQCIPADIADICIFSIQILSKKKKENYADYIRIIRESGNAYAYITKLSDMKDHLLQKEKLTDKKIKRYFESLPTLM